MNAVREAEAAAGLRVVPIDPFVDRWWEAYAAGHPEALVYQHPAWLRVLCRTFGYPAASLAVVDGEGRPRGVLPLVRKRGLRSGHLLTSLPHTPVAGPLASDPEAAALLVRAAVERVRREPGLRLQLKAAAGDVLRADGLARAPWRTTYVRELPDDPKALRFGNARNHARIKWAAGKAARCGVVLRDAVTEDDLRAWYPLYLDTLRERVVPPLPYRFFQTMWEEMRPHGCLRLVLAEQHAEHGTQLLAGSIFLGLGSTLFYAFTGRRRDGLALRPNDAIHWQVMREACAAGYRQYDFGEVTEENEGLAEFKGKWGTEARRLERLYYPAPRGALDGALASGGRARVLAGAAWRRLPLRATALLGGPLYRWL